MRCKARTPICANTPDGLRRDLDRAVFDRLHTIVETRGFEPIDSIRGIFTEGPPAYPGAGFPSKPHIQIAVRNVDRIRGLFRVPKGELKRSA